MVVKTVFFWDSIGKDQTVIQVLYHEDSPRAEAAAAVTGLQIALPALDLGLLLLKKKSKLLIGLLSQCGSLITHLEQTGFYIRQVSHVSNFLVFDYIGVFDKTHWVPFKQAEAGYLVMNSLCLQEHQVPQLNQARKTTLVRDGKILF